VGDAVDAILRLVCCDGAVGEVVNIGNDVEISMEALAYLVRERAQSNSPIRFVPYDEAYAPGFEDMQRRVPSLGKLSSLTGFRPTTPLKAIIDQVISYMKDQGRRVPLAAPVLAPSAA
jgi:UDP-glucose 4-epimerase